MLSKSELYYFNRALTKRDIYGFNKEKIMKEMRNKGENIKKIRENLIEKGYLNKDGSINKIGFHVIRTIEKYNNANKFYYINGIMGSIDKNNFFNYIMEAENDQLVLSKIPKEGIILYLIKYMDFLKEPSRKISNKSEEEIDLKNIMIKFFSKEIKESLYIKVCTRSNTGEGKVEKYNIYFKETFGLYKYDAIKGSIVEISSKKIRMDICEIFGIEVNKSGK